MTDLRIHSYTAAEPGLFVNSYLLETTEGVLLVDANLLVSDARALAARPAALHKPLLAVFVTHAHPDHFNGWHCCIEPRQMILATNPSV